MKITLEQIKGLLAHPETLNGIQSALDSKEIDLSNVDKLSEDSLGYVIDAALDSLSNYAPIVKEYEAEQDKGVYPINIIGVNGCYIVCASEYPNSEIFNSLDEAEYYVNFNYGEFLI
jgi:hypothetical protein